MKFIQVIYNNQLFSCYFNKISLSLSVFLFGIAKEFKMKQDIHPKYNPAPVVCSCGYEFTINSTLTKSDLHIDVCSQCHPFFTGKQKLVDTAGRVDKFKKKYGSMLGAKK